MGQTYLKGEFSLGHCFWFTNVLASCKVQCFLVRFYFQLRWKTCVIAVCLVLTVGCIALEYSHHCKDCSTPLWIGRGNDLFFSCLFIWRFMLVMFGNNTWVKRIWKEKFRMDIVFGLQMFWRVVRYNASLWNNFFQLRWKTCVIAVCLVYFVGCSALDDLHYPKVCSTPLWKWRGNELFSPVSASGVLCLWCLGITHGSNIIERRIFAWTLFLVYNCFGEL